MKEGLLQLLGLQNVEFHAAKAHFRPDGMEVNYIGPDGNIVEDSFKEAHTRLFLSQGYNVIYAGNGVSDIYPARLAQYVFATADLRDKCRETGLNCIPFNDLNDIIRGLKQLSLK